MKISFKNGLFNRFFTQFFGSFSNAWKTFLEYRKIVFLKYHFDGIFYREVERNLG